MKGINKKILNSKNEKNNDYEVLQHEIMLSEKVKDIKDTK